MNRPESRIGFYDDMENVPQFVFNQLVPHDQKCPQKICDHVNSKIDSPMAWCDFEKYYERFKGQKVYNYR